jgi:hypothetical protein
LSRVEQKTNFQSNLQYSVHSQSSSGLLLSIINHQAAFGSLISYGKTMTDVRNLQKGNNDGTSTSVGNSDNSIRVVPDSNASRVQGGSTPPSKYHTDCQKEHDESLQCIYDNYNDKSVCQPFFDAYKACSKEERERQRAANAKRYGSSWW